MPKNGTRVRMGERRGKVDQSGHPPWGIQIRVLWDDGVLAWHPASELDYDE